MYNKSVEVSFNLDDPVEKRCYDELSKLDPIRRAVFISALFKKFVKDEDDVTKLESRLLDIIDNLTKNIKVNQIQPTSAIKSEIKEIAKKSEEPKLLKSIIKESNIPKKDPLSNLADEGFE